MHQYEGDSDCCPSPIKRPSVAIHYLLAPLIDSRSACYLSLLCNSDFVSFVVIVFGTPLAVQLGSSFENRGGGAAACSIDIEPGRPQARMPAAVLISARSMLLIGFAGIGFPYTARWLHGILEVLQIVGCHRQSTSLWSLSSTFPAN
jgi:hypothetical protein